MKISNPRTYALQEKKAPQWHTLVFQSSNILNKNDIYIINFYANPSTTHSINELKNAYLKKKNLIIYSKPSD